MLPTTPFEPLNFIILTRAIRRSGDVSDFYRRARTGAFVRIAEGVYFPTRAWEELSTDEQFLVRIHSVAIASRPGLVFSHLSAAALWRLPIVGSWPARPEAIVGREARGPSRRAFTARQFPVPSSPASIDGLKVTPLARTLVDVARTRPLTVSVAMLDHALRESADASITRQEVMREFAMFDSPRGSRRCREAIDLADGRSGSAGESVSRIGMHLLELPAPVLQHEFRDAHGAMVVDFWWPALNIIGEFDGLGKYLREELRSGQTVADAVISEKWREDRLRALGPRVTRWGWSEAISPRALGAHLRSAGVG